MLYNPFSTQIGHLTQIIPTHFTPCVVFKDPWLFVTKYCFGQLDNRNLLNVMSVKSLGRPPKQPPLDAANNCFERIAAAANKKKSA